MVSFAVILPAAGKSSRFSDPHHKKPFAPLDGKPVWLHVAERFSGRADVAQTLLVLSPEDREYFEDRFAASAALMGIELVDGGKERSDSVMKALARVKSNVDFVAVHDAARPCIIPAWIDAVFAAAQKHGAAMLGNPVTATLKKCASGRIEQTVSRENLWEGQTPQVFRRELLLEAYARLGGKAATDDAQVVEMLGHPIQMVPCNAMNIKITTQDDLRLASAILKVLPKPKLMGSAHPFEDDALWR